MPTSKVTEGAVSTTEDNKASILQLLGDEAVKIHDIDSYKKDYFKGGSSYLGSVYVDGYNTKTSLPTTAQDTVMLKNPIMDIIGIKKDASLNFFQYMGKILAEKSGSNIIPEYDNGEQLSSVKVALCIQTTPDLGLGALVWSVNCLL